MHPASLRDPAAKTLAHESAKKANPTMLQPITVLALAVMVLAAGCTSSDNEDERAAACQQAIDVIDQMEELENFGFERLSELTPQIAIIEAPDDVDAALQKVDGTTTLWLTALDEANPDDVSHFEMRDDVVEARLALRRICR